MPIQIHYVKLIIVIGHITLILLFLLFAFSKDSTFNFQNISKGIEYQKIDLSNYSEYAGELHIVKINPKVLKPSVFISSELKEKPMTAKEWCNKYNINIAINLGMYHKDFSTHVGYLRNGDYINNPKFNQYKSALVINPIEKGLPYINILDLDKPEEKALIAKYKTAVQNLRLIKGDRINVWSKSEQKWQEASVGIDKSGNILLFFTKAQISMYEFNEILLRLPIQIIKAYHTDGGPPASLSIHINNFDLDLSGNIVSNEQEPIPNILGFSQSN